MMSSLHYHHHELYIEEVSLESIAKSYGTPCYIYSRAAIERNWQAFHQAFDLIPHDICYAVKANSNIHILRLLAQLGSGFDIVSGGELARVITAGGNPNKVVFSGVGKTSEEMIAAINHAIFCFDIESEAELERLNQLAESKQVTVQVALRINPNVDPRTHSYISTGLNINKFGIASDDILRLAKKIQQSQALNLIGIAAHIGSQITHIEPFLLALDELLIVYEQLKTAGIIITHLNLGGGLGITYANEKPPTIKDYAQKIQARLKGYPLSIILEPGRAIVGNAGVLITQVEYLKHTQTKNFAIVNAGMNDLLRPALYQAWQSILPVKRREEEMHCYDIAGPVCESADFLGKDRELAIHAGDLLAIDSAGAYGFSMSSTYNSRPRPPEVLVDKDKAILIRRRESYADLFAAENGY